MGQYFRPVSVERMEKLDPFKLDSGLKLWEQLANVNIGRALVVLLASHPEQRGGGDLDLTDNWHGPERTFPPHNATPGPMPEGYAAVAKRTIGRWVGTRVVLVGDYAAADDNAGLDMEALYSDSDEFTDVTEDVLTVLRHELHDSADLPRVGAGR